MRNLAKCATLVSFSNELESACYCSTRSIDWACRSISNAHVHSTSVCITSEWAVVKLRWKHWIYAISKVLCAGLIIANNELRNCWTWLIELLPHNGYANMSFRICGDWKLTTCIIYAYHYSIMVALVHYTYNIVTP